VVFKSVDRWLWVSSSGIDVQCVDSAAEKAYIDGILCVGRDAYVVVCFRVCWMFGDDVERRAKGLLGGFETLAGLL